MTQLDVGNVQVMVPNNEIIKSSYSLRTKSQGEPFKRNLWQEQDKKEN